MFVLHNDQVERPQKASKGDAVTTRKRAMSRPVDGLVGKFVWVVDDEKYGRHQCLSNPAVTGDRKAGVRCKGVVGTPNQKGEA